MAKLESLQNKYSYCGECNARIVPIGHYNYCPHCGAKFRGKAITPYRDFGYELTEMLCLHNHEIYNRQFWTLLLEIIRRINLEGSSNNNRNM